jgi:hypothetical protein
VGLGLSAPDIATPLPAKGVRAVIVDIAAIKLREVMLIELKQVPDHRLVDFLRLDHPNDAMRGSSSGVQTRPCRLRPSQKFTTLDLSSHSKVPEAPIGVVVGLQWPLVNDLEDHVAGIRQFESAGFTHVALIQVREVTQEQFIAWAATELLPALRTDDPGHGSAT